MAVSALQKTKVKNPRIIFDWQRSASAASKKGWEARWERAIETGAKVGPKGEAYLEQKYGPVVGGGGGGAGGGGGIGGGGGGSRRRSYDFDDDVGDWPDYDFDFVEYDSDTVSGG